ncbi:MAG TPA: hypothetical protein VFK34_05875 [Marmoricola sp.]|nr:hypothetical protein [Marmoricola sp.]
MTDTAPLPLAGMARAELDRFVAAIGRRRTLVPHVYVGEPGAERVLVSTEPTVDPQETCWRADLVERAVEGAERAVCGWITRSGELRAGDHDLAWWAACRSGFERHGLALPAFFLMNRHGWLDLVSGAEVHYHRIRRR